LTITALYPSGRAGKHRYPAIAALLLSALFSIAPVNGQTPAPAPPGPATSAGAPQQSEKAAGADKLISKQQAKELFDSVDQIMQFASDDTALAPVVKVKRRLVTRDEVTKYLVKSFDDDESAKRFQRSEIVLKKFGMLSRDFDLRPFLLSLLTEQIAGYYDDKTKTVNLLNWVDPEEQKPVLAHELTHALQDQKIGLEKWSSDGFKGISQTTPEDNLRIASDEVETARQAVAEGQAMVVFVDYTRERMNGDGPANDSSGSSIMDRAPLLLQRSLMFPYSDGLAFEQALLAAGGKPAAFTGALTAPPTTSFEIMHPQAYLRHVAVPVLHLPDVHSLLDATYAPYDVGAMGELDVEMMASLFGGPELAQALAPAWAGGIYYAAQRRAATQAEKTTTGSLALLYYSQWRTPEAARGFAGLYAAEISRKYARVAERTNDEAPGETIFTTSEGDVLLSQKENGLFISEGFPLALARKLREATEVVQGSGPMRMASAQRTAEPTHELTLDAVHVFGEFGILKASLLSH
jgi:hypothetical protein